MQLVKPLDKEEVGVSCSMTESGVRNAPDHIVFQMLSTLALSSPVIMILYGVVVGRLPGFRFSPVVSIQ